MIQHRPMEFIITFLKWLEENHRPAAIFRGHADSNWKLVPSAFRPNARGIRKKEQLAQWRSISARFANPKPQNELEWLVLAQHYGIPTGLLDWTTNPLVALFFACQSSDHQHGCVIQCCRSNFHSFNRPESIEVFKPDRPAPALIDASAMNARTLAQDSVMSLHNGSFPLFDYGQEGEVYRVPWEQKPYILTGLRRFGFSQERLYSDITTAAQQFKQALAVSALVEIASTQKRQAEL